MTALIQLVDGQPTYLITVARITGQHISQLANCMYSHVVSQGHYYRTAYLFRSDLRTKVRTIGSEPLISRILTEG